MIQLKFDYYINAIGYKIIYMNQITYAPILDKIRSICKECNMIAMPEKNIKEQAMIHLETYLKTLELIRGELIKYRQLQEQYSKLEHLLQKQETQLRKKVGFQQQMKLYNDSLKSQIEDLQLQKLELLQNSKEIIKQLKKVNEQLFSQLNSKIMQKSEKNHFKKETNEQKSVRTDRTRTITQMSGSAIVEFHQKFQKDDQFRQITKTQHIVRDDGMKNQSSTNKKAKIRLHSAQWNQQNQQYKGIHIKQNSNTFQVIEGRLDRQIATSSKKKYNRNLYSNGHLNSNFLPKYYKKQQEKDLKNIYLQKSPQKKERQAKKIKNRIKNINRSLWKDKITNKSVMSVSSLQPALSNKQTL